MSQGKGAKAATVKGKEEATAAPPPAPEQPPQPRDAARAEKEEIVYLNLLELFPFKDHPFGVRDDAEMKGLVESVKGRFLRYGQWVGEKPPSAQQRVRMAIIAALVLGLTDGRTDKEQKR